VAPTVPLVGRFATEQFTFEGVDIPAGTHISILLSSANTDPGTFGEASFDITAQRTPPLTFGGGVHYCLGAWLARIEMAEALSILATRLGDITLAGPAESRPHIGITGPIALPLQFTGGESRKDSIQ
jgi:cytochrome P450